MLDLESWASGSILTGVIFCYSDFLFSRSKDFEVNNVSIAILVHFEKTLMTFVGYPGLPRVGYVSPQRNANLLFGKIFCEKTVHQVRSRRMRITSKMILLGHQPSDTSYSAEST